MNSKQKTECLAVMAACVLFGCKKREQFAEEPPPKTADRFEVTYQPVHGWSKLAEITTVRDSKTGREYTIAITTGGDAHAIAVLDVRTNTP